MPKPSRENTQDETPEQQNIQEQRTAFEQKIRKQVEEILAQKNN
jgi:hypothetical protein